MLSQASEGGIRQVFCFVVSLTVLAAILAASPAKAKGARPQAQANQVTAPAPDWSEAERWAWRQIEKGEAADFNEKCRAKENETPPDPNDEKDPRWKQPCRTLRGAFLAQILTQAPWREATHFSGVFVTGARIEGGIDLDNAKIERTFWLEQSRCEGAINLMRARTDNLVGVQSSTVTGPVNIAALEAGNDLLLRYSTFKSEMIAVGARVTGQVSLVGAQVEGDLNADSLQAGNLYMRSDGDNHASFKGIRLVGARVTGQVGLTGAQVEGDLNADSLQAGNLYMRSSGNNHASFKGVILRGARVTGSVDLDGAKVDGDLNANNLQAGNLFMRSEGDKHASFKGVILRGARVTGQVSLTGAQVDGDLNADSLQAGDLFLRDARFAKDIDAVFAAVGSGFDLRGAALKGLNLTGASVKGDLLMGGADDKTTYDFINLRNAHIGNLSDEKEGWDGRQHQSRLALNGFTFGRLGALKEADLADPASARPKINLDMRWWDKEWARRDPVYSPSPYNQLASALKTAGEADAADEIRFLGRERAREAACEKGVGFDCGLQTFLGMFVGYGIGGYAFRRTLCWIVGLSLFGMFVWRTLPAVREQGKSWLWCFGLGLSRVLPVIELNKEFTAFFEKLDFSKLDWLQTITFYGLRLVGWILGLALVAAVTGLTQGL